MVFAGTARDAVVSAKSAVGWFFAVALPLAVAAPALLDAPAAGQVSRAPPDAQRNVERQSLMRAPFAADAIASVPERPLHLDWTADTQNQDMPSGLGFRYGNASVSVGYDDNEPRPLDHGRPVPPRNGMFGVSISLKQP